MIVLAVLPVTIHNHRAGDGRVLISSQAGSALVRYRLARRLLPQVGYIQEQIARLEAEGQR